MKSWSDWELTRRQVTIGGRVMDASGRPAAGARITITAMPKTLQRPTGGDGGSRGAAGGPASDGRFVRAAQRDGIYFFLDLPAGRYTLEARHPRGGAAAEKTVSVSWRKDGKAVITVADFELSDAR